MIVSEFSTNLFAENSKLFAESGHQSHPLLECMIEGGEGMELGRPSHWTKIVSSEAGEIFTLGMNYSKPWAYDFKDTKEGNTSNCLLYCPDWISSWKEWKCFALQRGCPCTSDSPPVLQLRASRPTLNPSNIL